MKNCRHQPYAARVQYLAVKAQVEELLAVGHCARHIYDKLRQADKISMGYSAFCDYVRGAGKRLHKNRGSRPHSADQRSEPAAKKTFVHSNRDAKDLI